MIVENNGFVTDRYMRRVEMIRTAAEIIGATASDIPGLWNAPGYPELTTAQLLQIAVERNQ